MGSVLLTMLHSINQLHVPKAFGLFYKELYLPVDRELITTSLYEHVILQKRTRDHEYDGRIPLLDNTKVYVV